MFEALGATVEGRCAVEFRALGLDVFGSGGVNAEVPDIQIEFVAGEDFDERVFAELEWSDGSELEPLIAWQRLSFHLDDVGLRFASSELKDAKAIDDASVIADIDALDDIAAVGISGAGSSAAGAGGSVSIDGESSASFSCKLIVADTDIEDGILDMELDV